MLGEFCSKDFYCIEIKSFNEMTDSQQKKIIRDKQNKESLKLFKKYVNTYYEPQERKIAIADFKNKLKSE